MSLSGAHKLLLVLLITTCLFSGNAEAWSFGFGFGPGGGWGWGSPPTGSGSSGSNSGGSNSNSGSGSGWGIGWVYPPNPGSSSGCSSSSSGSGPGYGWGYGISCSSPPSILGSTYYSDDDNNHTASTNNHTEAPKSHRRKIEITVWKNGFDYQEWVSKHAPFYVNDVLVVKYNNNDQTQSKTNNQNDVYLLPDSWSYKRCDVTKGKKLVARGSSSSQKGFKLLLRKSQSYYFTSGDHNSCNNHNMKFSITPIPHPNSHNKP